jgi:hypothetical protein
MKRIIILYLTLLLILFLSYTCNAQTTTYNTYHIQHDTLVQTTIPEKIVLVGYYDSTIFDTSYLAYTVYQIYFSVDGSIVATIPIYDTIPEHDSVFICTNCASHDTTVVVVTPEPTEMIYGMFPNTGGTFASRVQLTKDAGNDAFRDNLNVGAQWKVGTVHDAGLKDLMTYNEPPCCQANFFATGTELTAALNRLENSLATAQANDELPEIISFNNEEPNFNYWKGTATDYVNWIKQATVIAHNHGVPVSNGGLLHNIFWYVRYVYQQEGKTDSVAMINAAEGIGPSTPAFAQVVIDWYKVEIPGLLAAGVDYLNFHFYNPKDKNDALTTPVNTLAIILKFLGRYNKPIITTETGTNNHNQTMFNNHMDVIKNAGVKVMTYYLGTGPLSEENLPFWSAWILQ